MPRTGVLLLGFGGPHSLDDVRPFMCNLMGVEPSDALVERVCRRYLTIGGSSPLPAIAATIASGLEERLSTLGRPVPVRVGMRYWHPFIADAVAELKNEGVERIVTVSLSPYESKVASGAYRDAIEAVQATEPQLEFVEAPLVSESEAFVDYFAGSTASALTDLEPNDGAIVAFTAHSLPEADIVPGDPYVAGLERCAEAIAARLGLETGKPGAGEPRLRGFRAFGSAEAPRPWFLVYQSKGAKPGAWLGPDLEELIGAAAKSGAPALVVVPIGFMTDHMETLYDLDVVAASQALDADLEFVRAPVPNDDTGVLDAIASSLLPLL
jgi:protoporphyrin/coproporphyrin ferrochelatase